MKTSWTITAAAFVLAVSLLAVKAEAHGGGHSMGSSSVNHGPSSFSSLNTTNHSKSIVQKTNFQTATNHLPNMTQPGNLKQLDNSGKQNSPSNFNKFTKISGIGKVNVTTFSGNSGGKGKSGPGKCGPGKCWWGGGFGYGWCGCYGDCCGCDWCPSYCYCDPCYASCCNVCNEYCPPSGTPSFSPEGSPAITAPQSTPVTRIAHIVNPAETQAALGYAVNGQAYTLEAGKSQDVEINEGAIIEFDRGSNDQAGRYTLSEGVYRFGSTSNGWELFHIADSSAADVASN